MVRRGGGKSASTSKNGGKGAFVTGSKTDLDAGDKLMIMVGQMGTDATNGGAGGGGSFVFAYTETDWHDSDNTLLVAAGGGGGSRT